MKLDPQTLALLQQVLNSSQMGAMDANGASQFGGADGTALDDWVINRTQGRRYEGGESGGWVPDSSLDSVMFSKPTEGAGGKVSDWWSADGTYGGQHQAQGGGTRDLNQAIALIAGGYFGGNALAGMGEGAAAVGAGEAAGSMANGAFLGEGVSSGVGAWDAAAINSALGSGQLGTAASYAGQNLANGTASDTLGSMLNSGNTASNAVNAADVLNTGAKAVGTGLNLGGVLGAAAGALSSKDQEQTTSRDPWKPAQPYLEGLLREGADLYGQYKAQPFNGAQQAGYNNMAGLLDLVNRNAGGLLSGFQANASGANQFRRGQPQGLIGSSFNPSPQEWNPQSYGRFGG